MWGRVVGLMAVVCLAVGACSGGGADETTAPSSLAAAPSITTQAADGPATTVSKATTMGGESATTDIAPSTTRLPGSVSYGPAVLVSGQEVCELSPMVSAGTTTVDSDGTVHIRDGQFECAVSNSDPRIAGTATYTFSLDRWTSATGDVVQVQWGTIRIENEVGAWEADSIGIFSLETGDIGAELYTGTGGYEGLYYYQWVFGTLGQPWPTNGLIFPDTVPIHIVPTL